MMMRMMRLIWRLKEVDSDEWEDDPVPVTDCLFCSHHSSTLDKNIVHRQQSILFPDPEFITNLEGLVEYLVLRLGKVNVPVV